MRNNPESTPRNDTIEDFHLDLAPGWALLADQQQWLLCRERYRQGTALWHPVGFIGSNKRVLARVMAREGLFNRPDLDRAVHAFLSASPQSFREWAQAHVGS